MSERNSGHNNNTHKNNSRYLGLTLCPLGTLLFILLISGQNPFISCIVTEIFAVNLISLTEGASILSKNFLLKFFSPFDIWQHCYKHTRCSINTYNMDELID